MAQSRIFICLSLLHYFHRSIKQTHESHERVVRLCSDWLTFIMLLEQMRGFIFFSFQLTASFNCLRFAFFRLQQLISGALFDVRCRNSEKLQSACDGREMHHFIFCLVAEWWMTNLCFFFSTRRESFRVLFEVVVF